MKKKKISKAELEAAIQKHYNTTSPHFTAICTGLRRLAINPGDRRVQTQLLCHGVRHITKIQTLIYTFIVKFQPALFVDVGVNYGECFFSPPYFCSTKIVGFEANPGLYPFIERSMAYNDDLDMRLVRNAVSDVAGQPLTFFVDKNWSGKSSAVPDLKSQQGGDLEKIEVTTTTLDMELCGSVPEDSTVLVKVDVEGYEPKVFLGATEFNKSVKNLVYLIEFDSSFLLRGEQTPEGFFNYLSEEFVVYLAHRRGVRKLRGYSDLAETATPSGRIHCDLMLVRSSDSAFQEKFDREIVNRRIADLAQVIRES